MKRVISFRALMLGTTMALAVAGYGVSAELKPYQKEALQQLQTAFGGMWPMVKKQYEEVISTASEADVKAIVNATVQARAKAGAGGPQGQVPAEADDADDGDDGAYEKAQAAREDIERQIDKPFEAFSEAAIKLGVARGITIADVTREIFQAEKGCRLKGVKDYVSTPSIFLDSKSQVNGIAAVNDARSALMTSGKYYKITYPAGSPPAVSAPVDKLIRDAGEAIKALNAKFGVVCADIKKRMDAIPYGGGVNVNKAMGALIAERDVKDRALSVEVKTVVDEMNRKIAELDAPFFEWGLRPLKNAQPQTGPVTK
ncbi:hypothetical protein [Microvirga flavescens]|uniref:hypothetical protein n=1 Tax=Microvirga flavescens TaxID=2249811 RepID=UPI000DDAE487|nr:hypothetical protein [Microvirga flavescens]